MEEFCVVLLEKQSAEERIGFVLENSKDAGDRLYVWGESDAFGNTSLVFQPSNWRPVVKGSEVSDVSRFIPTVYASCTSVDKEIRFSFTQYIDR